MAYKPCSNERRWIVVIHLSSSARDDGLFTAAPREVLQTLNGLKSGKDKALVVLGLFAEVHSSASRERSERLSRFSLRTELPTWRDASPRRCRDRTLGRRPKPTVTLRDLVPRVTARSDLTKSP